MKGTLYGLLSAILCIAMLFGCAVAPSQPETPAETQVPSVAEAPAATGTPANEPTAAAETA
ncbi:MAG TPA: hypothetical protein VN631_05115, partial [Negativicutes bacterium]|nr:hypothetical protein [Negativicutes bacterium]